MNLLGGLYGFRMVESANAVSEEIETVIIERTFWECLFDLDPTHHLWDRTIEKHEHRFVPAMYKVGDMFIYHPALRSELYRVFDNTGV